MYHVQLRQLPHVARAFNLTAEELTRRVLEPWAAGRPVDFQERRWDPHRARLTVYEAPELPVEDIGLGRGWANVTRRGTDVTKRMLEVDASAALKEEILARCASQPLALTEVVSIAGSESMRASERLALAEQAVWELLHAGAIRLARAAETRTRDEWRSTLLSWATWRDTSVVVEAAGAKDQATTSSISRARSESEANR